MTLLFVDRMMMDAPPRRTAQGYLVASPKIARTGVQEYLAGELGLTDRDPRSIVRIHRPEAEVFHVDALRSMAHMPITIEHPREFVDAKNWKELSRGTTGGEVARDGDFVRVPVAIMDAEAIDAVELGKKELSVGYFSDVDWTPGRTADGIEYHGVQRNIRGNHLAIVDRARGGRELRVIDHKPQRTEEPSMKQLTLDGITVSLDDTAHQVVTRMQDAHTREIAALRAQLKDAEENFGKAKKKAEELEAESKTKDAQIQTLTQQVADSALTPAKLDAAVAARSAVIDAARKVLPSVVVDGKTESEIRAQVVNAKLGDTAKGWNDSQIAASFGTLTAGVAVVDGVRNAHMTQPTHVSVNDAHAKYVAGIGDAWKTPPVGATH